MMTKKKSISSSLVNVLDEHINHIGNHIYTLSEGDNVLINADNKFYLTKFEDFEINLSKPNSKRLNRGVNIRVFDFSKRAKPEAIARLDVLGSHCIEFDFDEEFNLHLPSSNINDVYLDVAHINKDDSISNVFNNINIITDPLAIHKNLKELTRPKYFKENISPFLEGEPSSFRMPSSNKFPSLSKNKPFCCSFDRFVGFYWLDEVAKDLPHKSFVYVGSKEEVYLLSVAKKWDNSLYTQGTYVTSAKPMFWFSNNYLGHMSRGDMSRPLFKGSGSCNVAKYRTSDPAGFNGSPFIFQAMGRHQDCKNSIFTGEPDIITGSLVEASDHFKKTDFSEFDDVVKSYALNINKKTQGAVPNGKFFW